MKRIAFLLSIFCCSCHSYKIVKYYEYSQVEVGKSKSKYNDQNVKTFLGIDRSGRFYFIEGKLNIDTQTFISEEKCTACPQGYKDVNHIEIRYPYFEGPFLLEKYHDSIFLVIEDLHENKKYRTLEFVLDKTQYYPCELSFIIQKPHNDYKSAYIKDTLLNVDGEKIDCYVFKQIPIESTGREFNPNYKVSLKYISKRGLLPIRMDDIFSPSAYSVRVFNKSKSRKQVKEINLNLLNGNSKKLILKRNMKLE